EQSIVARFTQVSNRVLVDVRVADAAACERGMGTPKRDQAAVLLEQLRVPRVLPIPGHCPPRVLTPHSLQAELVTREDHRDSRRRHLQPDADELALARARDRPE